MSTEIEPREQTPAAEQDVVLVEEHGSQDLLRFSRDLQLAYGFSRSLVQTPFVPQQYQGNPGNAAAAIMAARGVGINDPMTALRSLDIIQGTPAFRANTLRALVQRAGHEMWVEEANSQRVVMRGIRRGESRIQESMWDIDRARNMGLTGKDNWKKQPQAMLTARATSELARLIAADTIAGLYSVEELSDGEQPADAVPAVESKPAPKRVMRRKKSQPVAEEKPAEADKETPADESAPAPEQESVPESTPEGQAEPSPEAEESNEAHQGDPMKPTAEEQAEWGLLPEGFES